jgi:hypothetical protein
MAPAAWPPVVDSPSGFEAHGATEGYNMATFTVFYRAPAEVDQLYAIVWDAPSVASIHTTGIPHGTLRKRIAQLCSYDDTQRERLEEYLEYVTHISDGQAIVVETRVSTLIEAYGDR